VNGVGPIGSANLGSTAASCAGLAGRPLLTTNAISDGRLVPALAAAPDVLSTKVHIARWNADLIGDRNTQVLVGWLAQAEETSRGVKRLTAVTSSADEAVPRADGPTALST